MLTTLICVNRSRMRLTRFFKGFSFFGFPSEIMNTNQKNRSATDIPCELDEGTSYDSGNLTSCSWGINRKERPNK